MQQLVLLRDSFETAERLAHRARDTVEASIESWLEEDTDVRAEAARNLIAQAQQWTASAASIVSLTSAYATTQTPHEITAVSVQHTDAFLDSPWREAESSETYTAKSYPIVDVVIEGEVPEVLTYSADATNDTRTLSETSTKRAVGRLGICLNALN